MDTEEKNNSSYSDGQNLHIENDTENRDTIPEESDLGKTQYPEQIEQKLGEKNLTSEEVYQNELDKKLYNEILEKLDILKKDIPKKQQLNISDLKPKSSAIEESIKNDLLKIKELVKSGLINSIQGQNLKKQVLKNAFDKIVHTERIKRTLNQVASNQKTSSEQTQINERTIALDQFRESNPSFFTSSGRNEVLEYLKSSKINFGKDELNKISEIIRCVEKAAIDRYLQKEIHEKTLKSSNDTAKQRLIANAQKTSSSAEIARTFTREQIGKMSGAEFAKHEATIMAQLKKGQIK